jgi:hypothetical protein
MSLVRILSQDMQARIDIIRCAVYETENKFKTKNTSYKCLICFKT